MSMREALQMLARFRHEFIALGLTIVSPVSILTINISKSPVVGGVATVPAILMIVLVGIAVWQRGTVIRLGRSMSVNIASFAVITSIAIFRTRGLSNAHMPSDTDLERIAAINTAMARYASDNKLDRITFSADRVVDYLNSSSIRLQGIEALHRNVQVVGLFGHGPYGIFATSRTDALRLIGESDVIVLTDPTIDRSHPYPSNTAIKDY